MRLLLVNPNTNATLTARLAEAVEPLLSPGETLTSRTATAAPAFIGSNAAIAAARRRLEAELPEAAADFDAVLLGCFGDLGIERLQGAIGKPVVSLWDACVAAVRASPARIGIVTTSAFWIEELHRLVGRNGLSGRIRTVTAIGTLVSDTAALTGSLRAAILDLRAADALDAVVLGGALLAVLAPALGETEMPLVDLFGEALSLCRRQGHGARHS